MRSGATRNRTSTPSISAASTSSSRHGISRRVRRYSTVTARPSSRSADRAQSIAVLPPPMTMTSAPSAGALPAATSARNSMPASASSSPSQRSAWARWAPMAMKTASCSRRRSASEKSRPQRTPIRNVVPSARMASISASSASLGRRIGRDAVPQHAARRGGGVEQRALVPLLLKEPGGREPRRAGADDRHVAPGSQLPRRHERPGGQTILVGRVAVEGADRQLLVLLAAAAVLLAERAGRSGRASPAAPAAR